MREVTTREISVSNRLLASFAIWVADTMAQLLLWLDIYELAFSRGFHRFRWWLGGWRAWRAFHRAYATVPAYRRFIDAAGGVPRFRLTQEGLPDMTCLPEIDKESYVKKFPIAERAVGGVLPSAGVTVDESSGSSGQPTSWVRGRDERRVTSQMMRMTYRRSVQAGRQVFILNAFALGAWATGMNVSASLTDSSILKSTGPNADKIVSTIREFGPSYHYVIMGYPPFLKSLADDPRIDWPHYSVDAGYGGEGISESLRSYLQTRFKRVIGSYGASDLEVNMAIETDLAIALRRAVLADPVLRAAIIRTDYGVTPMIFQFNPLAYLFETNDKGELVVTMSRPIHLAPKIRYNIHDRGHAMPLDMLRSKLKALGREDLLKEMNSAAELPLLFIYGRSDMSIEYYGAKVTPDSVREVLYGLEDLAPILNTFRLLSFEDERHNKRMEIVAELTLGATLPANAGEIGGRAFAKLAQMNGDFYNAMNRTATPDNMPRFTLYPFETGPFAGGQRKLKNEYVASTTKYDRL
jgi:phenylacetate-CoA ligase